MNKYLLDGNWNLVIAENRDVKKNGFAPVTVAELNGSEYTKIEGSVPGNFELDMVKAGLLEDPFYSTNTLKLQELENRHFEILEQWKQVCFWIGWFYSFNGLCR